MGLFPESLLNEIRQALRIEPVLERINYRPEMIQDNGSVIKCFCPIHREAIFRTLLIDKEQKTYRCSNYQCPGSAGGDLIDLYAQATQQGYDQAVLEMASLAGVAVDPQAVERYVGNGLEVARNYLQLGAHAEAEAEYNSILRFHSDCLPALDGLIRIYQALGRQADFQAARLKMARALAATRQQREALELYAAHARENAQDYEARREYIELLNATGQPGPAAEECIKLADELAARGEIDQALACYRQAQGIPGGSMDATPHIIHLLTSAGRRDEAMEETLANYRRCCEAGNRLGAGMALQTALEMDPLNERLAVSMAQFASAEPAGGDAFTRAREAIERLLAAETLDGAEAALDALGAEHGQLPQVMELRARLAEARGNHEQALDMRLTCIDSYQQRHDYAAALSLLEAAMQDRPPNVALLSRKAALLRESGRPSLAVPVYQELAELFRNAEEYEHAAAVCQTLIDLEPDELIHREDQLEFYILLGMEPVIVQKCLALVEAYVARKEVPLALRLLASVAVSVPGSQELLLRQAELFDGAGRRGEAAEQYLAAAQILMEQNNGERARLLLERALRCVPEHLEAREALADTQAGQGLTPQALGIYTDLNDFYLRERMPEAVLRVSEKILAWQSGHAQTLQNLANAHAMLGAQDKQLEIQTRLVDLYVRQKAYGRATELCEEILAANEDYAPAIEKLVEIAESARHPEESVKYLWKLSQAHARAGRREAEQAVLQQVLAKDAMHMGAWFRHIELLMQWATPRALDGAIQQFVTQFGEAGRAADAIQTLEDLRQTSTPKPEIFAGLARLCREAKDAEGLKRALRTQAELLGKLLRDTEALEVWLQLAELEPDNPAIRRMRIEIMLRNAMTPEAHAEYRALAAAYERQGNHQEAEAALRELLEANPRDRLAREQLISLLINIGDHERVADQIEEGAAALLEEGQPAAAIALYARTFEYDAKREDIYRKIIAVRQRMGDVAGALADYSKLLDLFEAREAMEEFELAAQEALKLEPMHKGLRGRLGEFYIASSRFAEAEQLLLGSAAAQMAAGGLDAAEALILRVLEFSPDSLAARAQRAELLAKRGQTNEALSEFISLSSAIGQAQRPGSDAAMAAAHAPNYDGIPLIKEYTFENFVVGTRNNFAHATAMAVSRAPARNYNPLFLYSDVGLGKTHLCHAIAHYVRDRHPEFRILYTTTEEFVAELIDSIQSNQIGALRARHKLVDVLIIDDVQFLSGKERAQEEFFNIFNTIYQAGKQVVLTSDRPPKDISHLEKRLKSRFGAGIIVDIQPPDLETRVAILRQEVASRNMENPPSDDVLLYIAEHMESNIRELKGSLNQALARQDLTGTQLTPDQLGAIIARNYTEA